MGKDEDFERPPRRSGRIRLVATSSRISRDKERLLSLIADRPYGHGTFAQVRASKIDLLCRHYGPVTYASSKVLHSRMESLQADVMEFLFVHTGVSRWNDEINALARNVLQAVSADTMKHFKLDDESEAADHKRIAAKYAITELTEGMMTLGKFSDLESLLRWLEAQGRTVPSDINLIRLAISEINEGIIGTRLPRVLVLSEMRPTYPLLAVVSDEVVAGAPDIAMVIRTLFSY